MWGGATIYTRTAQYGFLHVAESAFEGIRSSSEPYALTNSRNVREALGTTWALSETGSLLILATANLFLSPALSAL